MDAGSLLLLAIPVLLLFMITSQNRRRKREIANVQSGLAPGSRVMTTSGMYGTVTAIEGDEVVLESAPGQVTRWNRQAMGRIITPVEAGTADTDEEDGGQEPGVPEYGAPEDGTPQPGVREPGERQPGASPPAEPPSAGQRPAAG